MEQELSNSPSADGTTLPATFAIPDRCVLATDTLKLKPVSLKRNYPYLCHYNKKMDKLFEIIFLDDAFAFLRELDKKHYEKILFNIRKAQTGNDPELFKKLTEDIWELRTLYQGLQYRLLAFWDKTDKENTLVISTHGFIKKRSKVPENEILKAKQLRVKYFEDKGKQIKNINK